jgi:hypothetical protein
VKLGNGDQCWSDFLGFALSTSQVDKGLNTLHLLGASMSDVHSTRSPDRLVLSTDSVQSWQGQEF